MNPKTVLIVDDDAALIEFLQNEMPTRCPDLNFIFEYDGYSALKHIYAGKVDFLLTDIAMQGMNGYDLYERVREFQEDLPVVMMTGFGWDPNHTVVKAKRHGLKTVLYKPFSLDRLEELIRQSSKSPEEQEQAK